MPRWTATTHRRSDGRVQHHTLHENGSPASFAAVLEDLSRGRECGRLLSSLLSRAPFEAFFFETPPWTLGSVRLPFEFVLVDAPDLVRVTPQQGVFQAHFRRADPGEEVVSFASLGGDAVLVVPCMRVPAPAYSHLATFVREAPAAQQDALWRRVGVELQQQLGEQPRWLSTSGLGVSWLHVRIDRTPKYYTHAPYRSWAGTRRSSSMPTQQEKAERFQALHAREGAFVMPNPWDIGSARVLQALGFEALATTSAGLANALGRLDGSVQLAELVRHCEELSAATDLPLSADMEGGFARQPAGVAAHVLDVARAGAVGASIEDFSGDPAQPIEPFDLAVERVQAAADAVRTLPFPFVLTARCENFLHGRLDLEDTLRRLSAYAEAGADVLYAPGLTTLDQIRCVVQSVRKPVNVLAPFLKGVSVAELAATGVRRISIGAALARAAMGGYLRAARETLDRGTFSWTDDMTPGSEVEALLRRWTGAAG